MKKDILDRYETMADGKLAIDISVPDVESLFSKFETAVAYTKKDLDEEFVDYLIESAVELKHKDFAIRINLDDETTEKKRERVRRSIRNYFQYLEELVRRDLKRLLGRSAGYFLLGCVLIALSVVLNVKFPAPGSIALRVMIEGITIAAWVSMWQAVANSIFEWTPLCGKIRTYKRIIDAPVAFRHSAYR